MTNRNDSAYCCHFQQHHFHFHRHKTHEQNVNKQENACHIMFIRPTTTTTAAELLNCTPSHYSLISTPRNCSNKISSSGGGTAFLIRKPFTQLPTSVPDFSSFESSSVTLQLSHSKLSVFNIYRRPSSSTHSKPFSVFLDDFSSFLSSAATTPHEFIITSDFNSSW